MGAAIAWPRSGGNINHNERSVKIDLWVSPLNERSEGLNQPCQTILISFVESNCKMVTVRKLENLIKLTAVKSISCSPSRTRMFWGNFQNISCSILLRIGKTNNFSRFLKSLRS